MVLKREYCATRSFLRTKCTESDKHWPEPNMATKPERSRKPTRGVQYVALNGRNHPNAAQIRSVRCTVSTQGYLKDTCDPVSRNQLLKGRPADIQETSSPSVEADYETMFSTSYERYPQGCFACNRRDYQCRIYRCLESK